MEPMNLGSPVGSPASPPTSPYLPSFLMGDPLSGGLALSPKSPSRLGRHVSFSGTPTLSPPSGPSVSPPHVRLLQGQGTILHTTEKPNGPPTRGLYDYAVPPGNILSTPHRDTNVAFNQTNESLNHPSACDVGNWVTVFGFPPASASVILTQFSHYGNIVDTRSSRQGNWVHIRYQTRGEARRALSNNGKVFGNTIMVGVVPCSDPEVLNQGKENVSELSMLSMMGHASTPKTPGNLGQSYTSPPNATYMSPPNANYMSPLNATYNSPLNATYTSPLNSSSLSRNVRPLGQAYRNAQYSSEVQMSNNTPQKSTSIVSKAWEMLGF